jgi:hypothetical protein
VVAQAFFAFRLALYFWQFKQRKLYMFITGSLETEWLVEAWDAPFRGKKT